jgi:surface protein
MFSGCSSLEYMLPENYSKDGKNRTNAEIVFDTSAVTHMRNMFQNCSSLKNLYATNWNVSKVSDMRYMFQNCSSMNFLDCGNWNTSAVTRDNMSYMFNGCSEMNDASVDFSSWCVVNFNMGEPDVFRAGSDITEAPAWGYNCANLPGPLDDHDPSVDEYIKYTFRIPSIEEYKAEASTSIAPDNVQIYIPIYDHGTGTTIDWHEDDVRFYRLNESSRSYPNAWNYYPLRSESYIQEIVVRGDVRSFYTNYSVGSTGAWNYLNRAYTWMLQSVEIVGMNSIRSAYNMFIGCRNLVSVDVSKWNSSNVTSCYRMFSGCTSLVNLDLSTLNTSNVNSLGEMFVNCTSLTNLNIVPNETNGTWNTSKVTSTISMFSGCSSLEYMLPENYSKDGKNRTNAEIVFDTSAVTHMRNMFQNCSSLKNLYATNWNVSKVSDMRYMFQNCSSMNFLDCGNWNTSAVTRDNMSNMFNGCSEMNDASVDFSSWCVRNFNMGEPVGFRTGSDITEAPAWGQPC